MLDSKLRLYKRIFKSGDEDIIVEAYKLYTWHTYQLDVYLNGRLLRRERWTVDVSPGSGVKVFKFRILGRGILNFVLWWVSVDQHGIEGWDELDFQGAVLC